MFSFKDHIRPHIREQIKQGRPTCNYQVTHARATISQVTRPDQRLDVLQTCSSRSALRKRNTRSDVKPEPIFLLPDELEVNTSVTVQESCNIGRIERIHCVGLPSVLP